METKLIGMTEEEKKNFCEVNNTQRYVSYHLTSSKGLNSALSKIIITGYKALQLCYFFTAGKDEVKAWTIQVSIIIVMIWVIYIFKIY